LRKFYVTEKLSSRAWLNPHLPERGIRCWFRACHFDDALLERGLPRLGILLGIISGGIRVIVWKQISGGIFDLYEIVPGFVLSILVIVVFSKIENSRAK